MAAPEYHYQAPAPQVHYQAPAPQVYYQAPPIVHYQAPAPIYQEVHFSAHPIHVPVRFEVHPVEPITIPIIHEHQHVHQPEIESSSFGSAGSTNFVSEPVSLTFEEPSRVYLPANN